MKFSNRQSLADFSSARLCRWRAIPLLRQGVGYVIEVSLAPATRIVRWVINIIECKVRPVERILEPLGNIGTASIIGFFGENITVHTVRGSYQRATTFKYDLGSILVEDKPVIRIICSDKFPGGEVRRSRGGTGTRGENQHQRQDNKDGCKSLFHGSSILV